MTTYLVTGGAGFIGSHIVENLLQQPDTREVRVLDDLSTGRKENLAAVQNQIIFTLGDIRDAGCLARVVKDVDIIFHLAAQVSVPKSLQDPLATHAVNATGTLQLLQAARQAGVKRLILSSTCAVYGDDPELPKTEIMLPCPKSPYAVAKLAAEGYCQNYAEHFKMETVVLRYFNVYGPRQDPSSPYSGVISIFANRLINGQPVTIFGNGEQSRDFVYVQDVVNANLVAAKSVDVAGKVFNICAGQPVTINQLYNCLAEELGVVNRPLYAPERAGDIRYSYGNNQEANAYLEWQPKISLVEGLRQTIQSIR